MPPGNRIPRKPWIIEVGAINRVKDQAEWAALDPAAKLEALRRALVVLIERGERDDEDLGDLLRTFVTDDGGQTVLRRNLVVANGADIVIET